MMNGSFGAAGGAAGCGGLFPLLLVGLVIVAVYLYLKNKRKPVKKDPIFTSEKPSIDAAEIVRLRYARGEISLEEFQSILKNIQS